MKTIAVIKTLLDIGLALASAGKQPALIMLFLGYAVCDAAVFFL